MINIELMISWMHQNMTGNYSKNLVGISKFITGVSSSFVESRDARDGRKKSNVAIFFYHSLLFFALRLIG